MKTASLIRSNGYFINTDGKKTKKITNCTMRGYKEHGRHFDLHVKNAAGENLRIRTGELSFCNVDKQDLANIKGKACTIISKYTNKIKGYGTVVEFDYTVVEFD